MIRRRPTIDTAENEERLMTRDDTCDDTPWLREMIDDEFAVLFSDDDEEIARGVRHFVEVARANDAVEARLIDLLDTSFEHSNDDSNASIWAAVILGEIGSVRAISVLRRGLLADEVTQDTVQVALLRIGFPAIESMMDSIDEEENPQLNRVAYPLLGMVGVLEDDFMSERVANFLQARIAVERRATKEDSALEQLFQAIARAGDRRQLDTMKEIFHSQYAGNNPALQDAIELLEENVDGVAIGASTPPWEERYGWIF